MKSKAILLGLACLLMIGAVPDLSAQSRIRFAHGRTSATISGTLRAEGVRRYVLGARSGQSLTGNISSRGDCVKFTDGSTSLALATDSGDNWISVTNYCGRTATYT